MSKQTLLDSPSKIGQLEKILWAGFDDSFRSGGQQDCSAVCESNKVLMVSRVRNWVPKYLGYHTDKNVTIVDWIALPFRSVRQMWNLCSWVFLLLCFYKCISFDFIAETKKVTKEEKRKNCKLSASIPYNTIHTWSLLIATFLNRRLLTECPTVKLTITGLSGRSLSSSRKRTPRSLLNSNLSSRLQTG